MENTNKTVDYELEKRVLAKKKEIEKDTGRRVSEKGEEKIRQRIIKEDKIAKRRKNLALAGIGVIGLGLGATTAISGCSETRKIEENKTKTAVEADISNEQEEIIEKNGIEEIVDELENGEEVLRFIKNAYLEQREQQIGDDTLTTDDIKITTNYEDYVYINKDTGETILHGEKPYETEQALENDGIAYRIEDNVKMYKVRTNDGKIIDCVTLQNINGKTVPVKVGIGSQYNEQYESVLAEMGTVIPSGIEYVSNIEKDENSKIISKRKFVNSLKEIDEKRINEEQIQNEGYEIDD